MKQKIKEKVQELEEDYNITVVEARDFGSRAWGISNEDSDYDVAVLFIQEKKDYMTLTGYQETIDRSFLDGEIDIMGWNIKHFLEHCFQDKPSAFEFLKSEEVYYSKIDLEPLEQYVTSEFNTVSAYHHYRKLAKNQYKRYLEDRSKPTVKRNLYVFRGLLYAQWIEHERTYPPIHLPTFISKTKQKDWSNEMIGKLEELIELKKDGDGRKKVGCYEEDWVQERIERVDIDTKNIESLDKNKLDHFLLYLSNEEKLKG